MPDVVRRGPAPRPAGATAQLRTTALAAAALALSALAAPAGAQQGAVRPAAPAAADV
jgi:hypothetical protein